MKAQPAVGITSCDPCHHYCKHGDNACMHVKCLASPPPPPPSSFWEPLSFLPLFLDVCALNPMSAPSSWLGYSVHAGSAPRWSQGGAANDRGHRRLRLCPAAPRKSRRAGRPSATALCSCAELSTFGEWKGGWVLSPPLSLPSLPHDHEEKVP